ncbi:MAG: ABC transporter permease [Duodenibacillus sp.]|nr:ABC transporter permease [Duodenibacillus sp.]
MQPVNRKVFDAGRLWHGFVIGFVVLVLGLPIAATVLYAFASSWGATILPDGLTLKWFARLLSDARFLEAMGRSFFICLCTLAFSTLLVLPMVFAIFYYFPKLKDWMEIIIILPFAVPPVVSSVGLLQLYAGDPFPLVGTPWILIGTYFTITVPFMYRALANGLDGINLKDLIDAAHLLGANTFTAFIRCILPNLNRALLASLFISFSFLMGEFVFANILVGTRYETLQIYLYTKRMTSGHLNAGIVATYFFLTLILTWLAMYLSRPRKVKRVEDEE